MTPLWVAALALAVDTAAIERYYNATRTLYVEFEQRYAHGARERVESGTLVLRKPGRMRWDYHSGKQFVSDGKRLWYFEPEENRAEFTRAEASEDLRAPLVFLLGRLDFQRLFREVRREPDGTLVAIPKSDQSPYREIRLTAAASGRIEQVEVIGQDASRMRFWFRQERRNIPVDEELFRFIPPPGTQIVEAPPL